MFAGRYLWQSYLKRSVCWGFRIYRMIDHFKGDTFFRKEIALNTVTHKSGGFQRMAGNTPQNTSIIL